MFRQCHLRPGLLASANPNHLQTAGGEPAMTYAHPIPNDLESFWLPFTPNRQFKKEPRLLVSAKDMHYTSADGRQILDGSAGLWCVNAGHGRQ